MIIEGTLALTGQWFLTDYMERNSILPGWVEGFRLISQDEHRHVAYGTWFLREKAQDPALRRRIGERLAELIRWRPRCWVPCGREPRRLRDPRLLDGRNARVRVQRADATLEG